MTTDAEHSSRSPPESTESDSRSILRCNAKDNSEKDENNGEQSKAGGDEENSEGPPLPVGFWDTSLNEVRLDVFKNWAIVSKCQVPTPRRKSVDHASPNSLHLHLDNNVSVLGSSISR